MSKLTPESLGGLAEKMEFVGEQAAQYASDVHAHADAWKDERSIDAAWEEKCKMAWAEVERLRDLAGYSIDDIRAAFEAAFHNSGERYFGGEEDDTLWDWVDFSERLGGSSNGQDTRGR